MTDDGWQPPSVLLTVDLVILTLRSASLHVLLVQRGFDHRRKVADGVERARRKLEHSALATAFCGPVFTISELQQVYEAVWGHPSEPAMAARRRGGGHSCLRLPRRYQPG